MGKKDFKGELNNDLYHGNGEQTFKNSDRYIGKRCVRTAYATSDQTSDFTDGNSFELKIEEVQF